MNIMYRYRSLDETPYKDASNNNIHTGRTVMRIGDKTVVPLDCNISSIMPCNEGERIEPINANRYRFVGQISARQDDYLIIDCGIPIRVYLFNKPKVNDAEYVEFVGDLYGDYGADDSPLVQDVEGPILDIIWDAPMKKPLILIEVAKVHELNDWEMYM